MSCCGEPEVASHLPSVQSSQRAVARHPHVLAVGKPPAVQRRFLHGGHREAPVGLTAAPRCEPFHSSRSGSALALGNQSVAPL